MFLLVSLVTLLVMVSQAVLLVPELEQRFAIEPGNQLVMVGSKVTLPCKIDNKRGTVQWTKDDFGLGVTRNLTAHGYERYNMVGSDLISDWDLEIDPMTLEDEGMYQCQVTQGSPTESEIRSRFAEILVMMEPDPPRIVQGDYLVAAESFPITLECISYGGRPPAFITWSDDEEHVLSPLQDIIEKIPDVNERYITRSILRFSPKLSDRNRTYTCYSRNTAQDDRHAVNITVEVKELPTVDLVLSGFTQEGFATEGSDVHFKCRAKGNPTNVRYSWFLNGEMIGNFTTELILRNITKDYHEAIVRCEVANEYGCGYAYKILDFSSSPKFLKRPQSVEADLNDNVTLNCDVTGNPPPIISWLHGNPIEIVSHEKNFTVQVTEKTVGQYFCKGHIQGFADIEAGASIFVRDVPFIESPRIQFGLLNDTVQMECSAISVPAPHLVLWTFNGSEVNGPEFTILENPFPQGMRSTLIIRNSETRHFGTYNCTMSNAYGSDFLPITLQQPDITEEWEPTMVFNIVFTVLLLSLQIILVVALIWYTRYRKRPVELDIDIIENQTEEIIQNSIIPDSEATAFVIHNNPMCRYFVEPQEVQIEISPTIKNERPYSGLKKFPKDFIVTKKKNNPNFYDNGPGCSRRAEDEICVSNEPQQTVPPMNMIPVSIERYTPLYTPNTVIRRPQIQGISTKSSNSGSSTTTKTSTWKPNRWFRRYNAYKNKKRLSIIHE